MRGRINKGSIASLRPGEAMWDSEVKGFGVRRLASGTISFGVKYRWRGRQRWQRIGTVREVGPERARSIAKGIVGDLAKGIDPRPARESNRLRFDKIEDRRIRSADGKMLGGPVMADRTLAALRKMFRWYEVRDADFVSPIVTGMARTRPRERARDRFLSDDELRIIWPVLDGQGTYGAFIKTLLLTAARRGEVAGMRRSEIDESGLWRVPAERVKTGVDHLVPLPPLAREIIASAARINRSDLVFTTNGEAPISGFSKAKRKLDEAVLDAMRERAEEAGGDPASVEALPRWTIHDLRRTAKTLMQRAGVRPDVSERVLAHVIRGVEGTYDRHDYVAEKTHALEALAVLVERIVNPPPEGVVVDLRGNKVVTDA